MKYGECSVFFNSNKAILTLASFLTGLGQIDLLQKQTKQSPPIYSFTPVNVNLIEILYNNL